MASRRVGGRRRERSTSSIGRTISENSRWDLFLIAFVTAGLIVFPTPWFQLNFQGRFLFVVVLTALGLPTLVALALTRSPEPRTRLAARVGTVFVVVAVLAAIVSGRFGNSLFGLATPTNGLILTTALLGGWALGKSLHAKATPLLEVCLLGCALLNAGVAVVQGATGLGLFADRAPGFFDNPVFLAPLLVGGLWLGVHRASSSAWLLGGCVVLLAAAIQTSGSRSALLVLPLVVAATAWIRGWRIAGVVTVSLVVGLAVGAVCVGMGGEQTSSTTRAAQSADNGMLTTRFEAWSMATHAIRDHPVLGAGPGRFLAATGKYETLKLTNTEGLDQQFGDAHNIFVEYAVTTGLIGAALLLAFLVIALPAARWLSPLGGFAVLALVMHLVEPQDGLVTPAMFFVMGAAVPMVVAAKKPAKKQAERVAQQQAERRMQRRVTTARVILLVVGLAEVILIGLGAKTIRDTNGTVTPSDLPALYDSLRTATWELPVWAYAYDRLADLDYAREREGDPTASADEVKHRRQAAEREPYFATYWNKLAVAQANAGDFEGAKASFRRALEANPWAADIQVTYAKLLMAQGDTAEARRQLEHAVLALPDRREADSLLQQLGS